MWSGPTYAMSDLYFPKGDEKRTQQLTVRIPKSVKDGLEELSRFWSELSQERTGDPENDVSVSDVAVRLLQVGLAGAWGEVGGRPQSEKEWATRIAALLKEERGK